MNKRLRKKKHRGEYCEWGSEFDIFLGSEASFDSFLDDFVEKVEALNCYCAGGGKNTKLSLIVGLGLEKDKTYQKNFEDLKGWLASHKSVTRFSSTPFFDMWYGPYPPDSGMEACPSGI